MSGPEGLRAAGRALQYWQRRQEINAHNLANSETTGFQARRVFATLVGGGLPEVGTTIDARRGALRETGGALDLALIGDGHLVVEGSDGEHAVRSASFALDGQGRVIDERGRALLGEGGPLVLPPGPVEVDAGGTVTVAGEVVGRLRIERGPSPLDRGDPSVRPDAPGGVPAARPAETEDPFSGERSVVVRQGYLEGSNVSTLDALIEMTSIQRSHQAVQNSVRTLDATLETIVNRLGRIG